MPSQNVSICLNQFLREKVFELQYIFRQHMNSSLNQFNGLYILKMAKMPFNFPIDLYQGTKTQAGKMEFPRKL
jgi:hypothetical protein